MYLIDYVQELAGVVDLPHVPWANTRREDRTVCQSRGLGGSHGGNDNVAYNGVYLTA